MSTVQLTRSLKSTLVQLVKSGPGRQPTVSGDPNISMRLWGRIFDLHRLNLIEDKVLPELVGYMTTKNLEHPMPPEVFSEKLGYDLFTLLNDSRVEAMCEWKNEWFIFILFFYDDDAMVRLFISDEGSDRDECREDCLTVLRSWLATTDHMSATSDPRADQWKAHYNDMDFDNVGFPDQHRISIALLACKLIEDLTGTIYVSDTMKRCTTSEGKYHGRNGFSMRVAAQEIVQFSYKLASGAVGGSRLIYDFPLLGNLCAYIANFCDQAQRKLDLQGHKLQYFSDAPKERHVYTWVLKDLTDDQIGMPVESETASASNKRSLVEGGVEISLHLSEDAKSQIDHFGEDYKKFAELAVDKANAHSTCPVCYADLFRKDSTGKCRSYYVYPCNHIICTECLEQYAESCPSCRNRGSDSYFFEYVCTGCGCDLPTRFGYVHCGNNNANGDQGVAQKLKQCDPQLLADSKNRKYCLECVADGKAAWGLYPNKFHNKEHPQLFDLLLTADPDKKILAIRKFEQLNIPLSLSLYNGDSSLLSGPIAEGEDTFGLNLVINDPRFFFLDHSTSGSTSRDHNYKKVFKMGLPVVRDTNGDWEHNGFFEQTFACTLVYTVNNFRYRDDRFDLDGCQQEVYRKTNQDDIFTCSSHVPGFSPPNRCPGFNLETYDVTQGASGPLCDGCRKRQQYSNALTNGQLIMPIEFTVHFSLPIINQLIARSKDRRPLNAVTHISHNKNANKTKNDFYEWSLTKIQNVTQPDLETVQMGV